MVSLDQFIPIPPPPSLSRRDKLKEFIDAFSDHQNLTKLVAQIQEFMDQYNYKMPMDSLDEKTPSEIFLSGDDSFTPAGAEIVTPYEKDDELRMKFTDRDGNPARISIPTIPLKP